MNDQEDSRPKCWNWPKQSAMLLLAWLVLYGPIGFVMYLVTTFIFAFSGIQYRMTPVVNTGWQIVALVVLGMGSTALLITTSLKKALLTMLRLVERMK